jgi:THO complex subunit 2
MAKGAHDEFSQSLVEAIWIKHAEIPPSEQPLIDSFKNTLKVVLGQLIDKKVVCGDDCHLLLEADVLISTRQTKLDENGFKRMASQANTQKHYTQIKFNLLREENEGFAKLIVELSQLNINPQNVNVVSENIQRLIGYFSLDPSRVLDLLLTAFETNLQNHSYLTLLKEFGAPNLIT